MALTINSDMPEGTQIGRLIFVKETDGYVGTAALIKDNETEQFFVVSGVILPGSFGGGPEIMIFEADADGEVIDWLEKACWRKYRNLDEVMLDFSFMLDNDFVYIHEDNE